MFNANSTLARTLLSKLALISVLLSSSCTDGRHHELAAISTDDTSAQIIPNTIVVSIQPYASIEEALAAEASIDWHRDLSESRAITLAHAALEIQEHLSLLDRETKILINAQRPPKSAIFLTVNEPYQQALLPDPDYDRAELGEQGYEISAHSKSWHIVANSAVGVLYGAYRYLELLGFAWYDIDSIYVPEMKSVRLPSEKVVEIPRVNLRGFWIRGSEPISQRFALWMARNRLNLAARIPSATRGKLGLKEWGGGHELLQEIFSEEGLFEQHPDWFALYKGNRQPVVPQGTYFNPAFGNTDAANYFADKVIERLGHGDLKEVDLLNIWPTDSRFNRFDQSALAQSIGNETDNLLTFYDVVASRLRTAHQTGKLSRLVYIGGISYYLTWTLPTNTDVVEKLTNSNYLHVHYLNERSWSGHIGENLKQQDENRRLVENMEAWRSKSDFGYGIVEYYNYSFFAGIALTDFRNIAKNLDLLGRKNLSLLAYMHPLASNPGPRRLTNALISQLSWQALTDSSQAELKIESERTINDYFLRRYGEYATQWMEIYDEVSRAVDNSAEIYGHNSLLWVLFQHIIWGTPPLTDADDVVGLIPIYRSGGLNLLYPLPDGFNGQQILTNFRGLDESIELLESSRTKWNAILSQPLLPYVRDNMQSDAIWFEATTSRYRLMAATCDYIVAKFSNAELMNAEERMKREIQFLETVSVTADTISPINQRAFLDLHKTLLD